MGFLGITDPVQVLELEKKLIEKIKGFILELGKGFSFIGNQYLLEYNNKAYFVDMLCLSGVAVVGGNRIKNREF